jgi:catechol 2,3-dioxygenase-like lactoylglutathione lyase family enzyme
MTDPAPRIDFANLPAPGVGILVTLFITVRKVARSRDFYSRVLGGTVVLDENPCMVKLSNSWIIMNPGGPPTRDKPGISVVDYQPGNTTSIFLNLRVADIQACYEEWKAKGAEFVTPPIDRGAEIRCYMRDPDGYLIEVGQSTGLLHGKLAAKRPQDLLAELCHRPGNSGQQPTIRQPAAKSCRRKGSVSCCPPGSTASPSPGSG